MRIDAEVVRIPPGAAARARRYLGVQTVHGEDGVPLYAIPGRPGMPAQP